MRRFAVAPRASWGGVRQSPASLVRLHRANDPLDEVDLVFRESVLLVKIMIVPVSRPILGRNEGIDLPRGVLRGLVKEDEKARQTAAEVRQRALRLSSCIEG